MPNDEGRHKAALRPTGSWATLAAIGVLSVIMGLSFVFLRPVIVLLPEDQRFTGITPDQLKAMNAQLFAWIGMVFRSWGAFAIGLGTIMTTVAYTAYRRGDRWAWWALAVTGVLTFGIFLTVNVLLSSDFKWIIAITVVQNRLGRWAVPRCRVGVRRQTHHHPIREAQRESIMQHVQPVAQAVPAL